MKRILITSVLMGMILTIGFAAPKQKDLLGKWNYQVETAPPGYEKGTLVFTEVDGKLAGEVQFNDGYKVQMHKVEFTDGTLNFGLYVESDYITGSAKIEGKNMKGSVNTPDGEVPLTAEKMKE